MEPPMPCRRPSVPTNCDKDHKRATEHRRAKTSLKLPRVRLSVGQRRVRYGYGSVRTGRKRPCDVRTATVTCFRAAPVDGTGLGLRLRPVAIATAQAYPAAVFRLLRMNELCEV